MATFGNMGPFTPVNLRGGAVINAIPTWTDKLPLTRGGLAGAEAIFGRVVSVDPAGDAQNPQFIPGTPAGMMPYGILIQNPTIGYVDPAMNQKYYEGRPATVVTFGLIELMGWDLTQKAPNVGSKIITNSTTGVVGFVDSGDAVPGGYTQITGKVYENLTANGVRIWIDFMAAAVTSPTIQTVATPVANPGAGAVQMNSAIIVTSATPGATLYYTEDGRTPSMQDSVMPASGYVFKGPVTLKIIATKAGMNPSTMLSAAYTVAP